MAHVKDLIPDDTIVQTVLMGRSGIGKSYLAYTFPEKVVVFDFDGKVGVARNPDFVSRFGIRDIEYEAFIEKIRIKGINLAHNAYDDACRYFDFWMMPANRDKVKTFVIDSGTSLMEVARNKGIQILGGMSGKDKSFTFETAKKTGLIAMQGKDHGGERSLTEQFIRMVKDAGKNILVNVHQYERYDSDGNLVEVVPLFTGQSREIIPAMFKDVWHLKMQGAGSTLKRVLTAEYNGIYMTRSELGIGTIEDPTYDKIIERIKQRAALAIQQGITPSGVTPVTTVQAATG